MKNPALLDPEQRLCFRLRGALACAKRPGWGVGDESSVWKLPGEA